MSDQQNVFYLACHIDHENVNAVLRTREDAERFIRQTIESDPSNYDADSRSDFMIQELTYGQMFHRDLGDVSIYQ
jgi:BMFP domain-containing protein YqiC